MAAHDPSTHLRAAKSLVSVVFTPVAIVAIALPSSPLPIAHISLAIKTDAKRARQSYAPISLRARLPLAPQSVNVTVTAVPFPTNDDPAATEDAESDNAWGTSSLPSAAPVACTSPRQKRLIARASLAPTPPPPSARPTPPPPAPSPPPTTWIRRPSPLAPYWKPIAVGVPTRARRGRAPPEPLARRALRTHFSRTPHG
ncbi:hypothetical protein FS749_001448, partial [Ceratobasidium sp. UAMH 11750]